MERLYIFAPALIPAAFMLLGFAYFCVRTALGKQPEVAGLNRRKFSDIIGPLMTAYFLWLLGPIERFARKSGLKPNQLTAMSLVLCALAGASIATGHLGAAAWAYICAGAFDVLDGRLARANKCSSKAGAYLDSVSDRWGELFVFAGAAWFLRETPWLAAVMLAVAGSMMVSYTRARAEGLGVSVDGGTMQRAERILVVAVGTWLAAWFDTGADTAQYTALTLGIAMLITGVGSTGTSIYRWVRGYSLLKQAEVTEAAAKQPFGSMSAGGNSGIDESLPVARVMSKGNGRIDDSAPLMTAKATGSAGLDDSPSVVGAGSRD